MNSPTQADAQLMIQLAQWGTSLGVWDAMPALFADEFDSESADANEDDAVRTMLMFGETIGTLTRRGLLSAELITEWLWIEGLWERVGPAAMRLRERFDEPRLYENFESLAKP